MKNNDRVFYERSLNFLLIGTSLNGHSNFYCHLDLKASKLDTKICVFQKITKGLCTR